METLLYQLAFTLIFSVAAAMVLFPLLIKLSPKLGLVDQPDHRKLHLKPIPAIGGFVIVLSLLTVMPFSTPMRDFILSHAATSAAILAMMLIGLFDDRLNLSVKLRLGVQILCAIAIAFDGERITSLHGLLGITQLPLVIQYFLTVFIVTGVTNAFNLIDGIDGLAGSIAIVNIGVLMVMSILVRGFDWLFLLVPFFGALIVFLRYNWRPAKIFMGDSGSLVFGFIVSAGGIHFIQASEASGQAMTSEFIVLVTGYCMIPVMDAVRVFYGRILKGLSPSHADRTHLHHLLLKHHLVHSTATSKLLKLHIGILALSAIGAAYVGIHWIILGQIIIVRLYVHILRLMSYFQRWYRVIKKMELSAS